MSLFNSFKFDKTGKIYLFILICISFTIPLSVTLNSIAVGLLVIYWVATGGVGQKLILVIKNKFFWLYASFYLIQLVGILYSTDVADALSKLEKKAALLLFPFLILSLPALKPKQLFYVILAFACSIFGLTAFAVFKIWQMQGSLFNVPNLTETIDDIIHLHHAYSGLYIVFSICSLVYIVNHSWNLLNMFYRAFTIILILGLYVMLVILGARMAIFISFVVLGLQILIFTIQKRRFYTLAFISFTVLIGFIGILNLPSTRAKLNEILFYRGVYHPFTPRLIQWQCCVEVVHENQAWLQGVGTGDVKPLLQSCYQAKKFWGERYHYNSHNEYLEELMRHGLIGLFLLLLALIFPLFISIRQRHYLYFYFLFIFMIACLSEAILNRQKGVVFYAFFNALLFMSLLSRKNKFQNLDIEEGKNAIVAK